MSASITAFKGLPSSSYEERARGIFPPGFISSRPFTDMARAEEISEALASWGLAAADVDDALLYGFGPTGSDEVESLIVNELGGSPDSSQLNQTQS